MSSGERGARRESRKDGVCALILRLTLESVDGVKGTVGPEGGSEVVEFHGWIDFMAAIDRLRAAAVTQHEDPPVF